MALSLITSPKTPRFEKIDERTSRFLIEGCYPGYGITLGNSLRRVLLSSLEGAAVTEIKVKGVTHEFTTLDGVKEDMVQLILNLKKVRFEIKGDAEKVKILLKTKGTKEVTAKDIKLTAEVEISNKNQHIASLTASKSELEIELTIEKGVGYVAVEQRERLEKELGAIAIDGLFSPVEKVNFQVEDMRVGKRTDYDRIILEIKTDGTITPEDAYKKAVQVLLDQFNAISDLKEKEEEVEEKEVKPKAKDKNAKKDFEISALELSTRIHNVLESNELTKVSEVAKLNEKELRSLEGMGNKGVEEIKNSVEKLGYSLKKED
jgi:DNA-directed RNA polymerase subunit alpha